MGRRARRAHRGLGHLRGPRRAHDRRRLRAPRPPGARCRREARRALRARALPRPAGARSSPRRSRGDGRADDAVLAGRGYAPVRHFFRMLIEHEREPRAAGLARGHRGGALRPRRRGAASTLRSPRRSPRSGGSHPSRSRASASAGSAPSASTRPSAGWPRRRRDRRSLAERLEAERRLGLGRLARRAPRAGAAAGSARRSCAPPSPGSGGAASRASRSASTPRTRPAQPGSTSASACASSGRLSSTGRRSTVSEWMLRPARDEDAEEIAGLINAHAMHLNGEADLSASEVRRWFANPRFDVERDTRLAVDRRRQHRRVRGRRRPERRASPLLDRPPVAARLRTGDRRCAHRGDGSARRRDGACRRAAPWRGRSRRRRRRAGSSRSAATAWCAIPSACASSSARLCRRRSGRTGSSSCRSTRIATRAPCTTPTPRPSRITGSSCARRTTSGRTGSWAARPTTRSSGSWRATARRSRASPSAGCTRARRASATSPTSRSADPGAGAASRLRS